MTNQNRAAGQIEIELDERTAKGVYSNLVIISHSPSEFFVDFAAIVPGVQKTKVRSRIILTPEHAKRLMLSLQENVARYESNFGAIKLQENEEKKDYNLVPKGGEA